MPLANTKRGSQKGEGGDKLSTNIDGIVVKPKPLANTKRGSQKGGG